MKTKTISVSEYARIENQIGTKKKVIVLNELNKAIVDDFNQILKQTFNGTHTKTVEYINKFVDKTAKYLNEDIFDYIVKKTVNPKNHINPEIIKYLAQSLINSPYKFKISILTKSIATSGHLELLSLFIEGIFHRANVTNIIKGLIQADKTEFSTDIISQHFHCGRFIIREMQAENIDLTPILLEIGHQYIEAKALIEKSEKIGALYTSLLLLYFSADINTIDAIHSNLKQLKDEIPELMNKYIQPIIEEILEDFDIILGPLIIQNISEQLKELGFPKNSLDIV